MARFCKSCGARLKDGARFCESCGAKVIEEKPLRVFCSSCGKEMSPDAAFCPFCGAKRSGTAGPAPEQGPAARQIPTPPRSPASRGLPDYMQPGYQQRVRAERQAAQNARKPKKKGRGLSVFLVLVLAVQLGIAGFKYPGFLKNGIGGILSFFSKTEYIMGSGIARTRLSFDGMDGVRLGSIRESGCEIYVENGSFPEGSSLSAEPVSEERLRALGVDKIADCVVTPVDIVCDGYDGAFLDTDVVLTLPLPGGKDEAQNFAVAVYDERNGEIRCLFPDSIDIVKNTMSVSLPHLTPYFGLNMKEQKTVEEYLDRYSMNLAIKQRAEEQAMAELGPYVEAKIKALGLTEAAAKDLLYAVLGSMTSGDRWGFKGEGSEFAKQVAESCSAYGAGVMRDVLDNGEAHAAVDGMSGYVNSMVMFAWDKLGYSKKIDTIFDSKVLGGTAEFAASNAGSVGSMIGYLSSGTEEGFKEAMKELGGILQGVSPVVGYTTKGVALVANSVQMGFIEWKSNAVEELYQVYKNGGDFGWSGEVKPGDRETFLEYLHYGSGLSQQKGVARFYNMDKMAEICEKYGWSQRTWEELDDRYRTIFAQRAENALLAYFENRRQQENLAAQIREQERSVIETMLNTSSGALSWANYSDFFGEGPGGYDVSKRLERLADLRRELEPFVNTDKLSGTAGRDAGINFGSIMNYYVGIANYSGEEAAMEKLMEYLKEHGILREPGTKKDEGGAKSEEPVETEKPQEPKEPEEKETVGNPNHYVWALDKIQVWQQWWVAGWDKTGRNAELYSLRRVTVEGTAFPKVRIQAHKPDQFEKEYDPSRDTEFTLALPGRIVDLSLEGGVYAEAAYDFEFVASVEKGFSEPRTPNVNSEDKGPFVVYTGYDIYGKQIDDPDSDDPEDTVQAGKVIKGEWQSDTSCAYDATDALPEAKKGDSLQIYFSGAMFDCGFSVLVTYVTIPETTGESMTYELEYGIEPKPVEEEKEEEPPKTGLAAWDGIWEGEGDGRLWKVDFAYWGVTEDYYEGASLGSLTVTSKRPDEKNYHYEDRTRNMSTEGYDYSFDGTTVTFPDYYGEFDNWVFKVSVHGEEMTLLYEWSNSEPVIEVNLIRTRKY